MNLDTSVRKEWFNWFAVKITNILCLFSEWFHWISFSFMWNNKYHIFFRLLNLPIINFIYSFSIFRGFREKYNQEWSSVTTISFSSYSTFLEVSHQKKMSYFSPLYIPKNDISLSTFPPTIYKDLVINSSPLNRFIIFVENPVPPWGYVRNNRIICIRTGRTKTERPFTGSWQMAPERQSLDSGVLGINLASLRWVPPRSDQRHDRVIVGRNGKIWNVPSESDVRTSLWVRQFELSSFHVIYDAEPSERVVFWHILYFTFCSYMVSMWNQWFMN